MGPGPDANGSNANAMPSSCILDQTETIEERERYQMPSMIIRFAFLAPPVSCILGLTESKTRYHRWTMVISLGVPSRNVVFFSTPRTFAYPIEEIAGGRRS